MGKVLTVAAVKKKLAEIHAVAEDDEKAHGLEDALWAAVLEAIASGKARNPKALAAEALKSSAISFARWCA